MADDNLFGGLRVNTSFVSFQGSYSCHTGDVTPEPVCSKGKYLTVRMRKDELSHDGYDFNIELRQYMQSK